MSSCVFGSVRVCFEFRSIPARGKVRERVTSSFGVASCYTNTQKHKHRRWGHAIVFVFNGLVTIGGTRFGIERKRIKKGREKNRENRLETVAFVSVQAVLVLFVFFLC